MQNLGAQLKISDSTTVSTPALKRILIAAQQKNVLQEQVDILNQRITGLRQVINNLNEKDSATVEGYKLETKTLNEERNILVSQITSLVKQIKKERRKRKWTAFGGIAALGISTYLYIIK